MTAVVPGISRGAAATAREIHRLRAELAAARRELAELRAIVATPNCLTDPEWWRDLYRPCLDAAYSAGYRQGLDDEAESWLNSLAPAREAARLTARGPSFAELERRRWGPGGRSRFGDQRPGDYLGQRVRSA